MTPSLNYTVLTDALHALKEGNLRYCEALGFTCDELDAISRLSMEELFILSQTTAPFMNVTIQHDVLRQVLARADQEIQLQRRITRAIVLGGSIELLGHFFGLPSGEVCNRRRILGIQVAQGRTRLPDENTDCQIWLQWEQRRPENLLSMDSLDVMMDITDSLSGQEKTEALSLTVVWSRIMSCEKDLSQARER